MVTPDAYARAREYLGGAVAGLRSAADSLRAAAALLADPVAGWTRESYRRTRLLRARTPQESSGWRSE
jgi:hypothetical protein